MDTPSAPEAFITFGMVRDLGPQARFYEKVFGLPLALDQGSCRIYRVAPGGYVGFCERDDAPPPPEGVLLTFVTPDVEETVARLERGGAVVESPPARNDRFAIVHAFLRDPAGFRIEIQRFEDPRWKG